MPRLGALARCLLAIGIGAAGCGGAGEPAAGRPNLLVLMLDTTGAARLGSYGYDRQTTPRLDAFAEGALVFERALSTSNWTLPSHASIFTGLHARVHGATGSDGWLADGFDTLAERLAAAGYETYLFSANPFVSDQHNLAQGFQVTGYAWQEPWRGAVARAMAARDDRGDALRSRFLPFKDAGETIRDAFLAWEADRSRERPYFAFLNFMEVHRPRQVTRPERERFLEPSQVERSYALDHSYVARHAFNFGFGGYGEGDLRILAGLYDAALGHLDQIAGDLLERLERRGSLVDTLVVVVADHGEHTGDHGLLGHEYSLYDALLRVPLLLRHPTRIAPGRVADPVQLVDLPATLLALAGAAPARGPGRDLLDPAARASRGRALVSEYLEPKRKPLNAVARRHPELEVGPWLRPLRSIEVDGYKLIAGRDAPELYAVARDPGEVRDLAAEEPARVAQLLERLARWEAEADGLRPAPAPRRRAPLDRDQRRRLESLGYLEGSD